MAQFKNKSSFLFIIGYHLLLIALLPFVIPHLSWAALAIFLVTFSVGGISITAGYHRLYAHRSYSAHPVFEWAVLLGSMLALQWSALKWSHDHRIHHAHVDTDKDPYSIKKGFWYAHFLWLLKHEGNFDSKGVGDLLKNPRVVFQDKHYFQLALVVNVAVFGLGCLFVSPLVSLFAGVVLRIFCIHHCTWFINSLAHVWGSRTYARELTAVDNAVLALLTFGEGYHNYHHAFATDYRNGVRWYHFDPTKWLIWTASRFGITQNLRSVDEIRIRSKLVQKDKHLLLDHLSHHVDELAADFRSRLETVAALFESNATLVVEKAAQMKRATSDQRAYLRDEVKELRATLHRDWNAWIELTRSVANRYKLAH